MNERLEIHEIKDNSTYETEDIKGEEILDQPAGAENPQNDSQGEDTDDSPNEDISPPETEPNDCNSDAPNQE